MDINSQKLLITTKGLEAASLASPTGPYINITRLDLGSAYGYTPTVDDTSLHGNTVFTTSALSYRNGGDNTLIIDFLVPPEAGPFTFGEVGLMIQDVNGLEVLFGLLSLTEPVVKSNDLDSNVAVALKYQIMIRLEQSIAIFRITPQDEAPDVWTVDRWSDVQPARLMANREIPCILVKELDSNGRSSLLHQSSLDRWTVGTNYDLIKTVTVAGGTVSTVVVAPGGPITDSDLTNVNRFYVLEFPNGTFRSVRSLAKSGANYQFTLNAANLPASPTTGHLLRLHRQAGLSSISTANTDTVILNGGDNNPLTADVRINSADYNLLGKNQSGMSVWRSDVFVGTVEEVEEFPANRYRMVSALLSPDSGNLLEKRQNGLYYNATFPDINPIIDNRLNNTGASQYLTGCNGQRHASGTAIPSCAQMTAAINAAVPNTSALKVKAFPIAASTSSVTVRVFGPQGFQFRFMGSAAQPSIQPPNNPYVIGVNGYMDATVGIGTTSASIQGVILLRDEATQTTIDGFIVGLALS